MENYKQWMEQKLTSEDMDKLPKVYKPLDYDQIITILTSEKWNVIDNASVADLFRLVKAVEKAHGIV